VKGDALRSRQATIAQIRIRRVKQIRIEEHDGPRRNGKVQRRALLAIWAHGERAQDGLLGDILAHLL
jgi:hypothetical protein